MIGYTIDSAFGGGQNIYDINGRHKGDSVDGVFGAGHDIFFDNEKYDFLENS